MGALDWHTIYAPCHVLVEHSVCHCLDNMFFKIIGQDNDMTNHGYKEATAIKMLKLDLNVDEGRCYIPPLYNNLFQIKYLYI